MQGKITYGNIRHFAALLKNAGIGMRTLVVPTALALAASAAEGASLGLLIPALDSIIYRSGDPVGSCALPGCATYGTGTLVALIFIAAVLKTSLAYLSSISIAGQVAKFAAALRTRIYEGYLGYGKLFFDRSNSGTLHQVLTTYVSMISRSLSALNSALYSAATLLVYLAIMLAISWKLTALVLACFPILHYSLRSLIRKIAATSNEHTDVYNQLGKSISNSIGGISIVQGYNAERREVDRFAHMSRHLAALELSVERKALLVGPAQELILLLFLFALIGLMAALGGSTSGNLLTSYAVYLLVLRRAAALFGVFNSIYASFAGVAGPVAEVWQALSPEGKHSVRNGEIPFSGIRHGIECRDLFFRYSSAGQPALQGVSATFRKGAVTAIVGASGSGKSTFINLLMRFYEVEPGMILVDGIDIREFDLSSWRSRVALVGQDAFLFDATLEENLTYGMGHTASAEEIGLAIQRSGLAEFVASLPAGLRTVVGDRGVQLSGGERQRVAIARAILRDAEILLLDEPTSALDSNTERLIQAALDDLVRDRTTIVVAHRLSTIRNADKIFVFDSGRIIESGSFDELCRSGEKFSQYWSHQST